MLEFSGKTFKLEIVCGSGTYIRSIGRDIAEKLGTVATMTSLIRTKVGSIDIEKAYNISNIDKDNVANFIIKLDEILNYPIFECDDKQSFKLLNGQILETSLGDGIYKLNNQEDTIALIKITNNKAKMWLFLG